MIAVDVNIVTDTIFPHHVFNAEDNNSKGDDACLHVFCDASISAYGALAYICRENQSALVMAATLVPVNGARLAKHVSREMDVSNVLNY